MNKDEFYKRIKIDLNIELDALQKENLEKFASLLLDYNKHTNITAIRDVDGVYLKHFYDSLTLVKVINIKDFLNVLDVGSGGGFPGIVLAIVFPMINITLLDSNHKKSDFQNYIVQELKLNNVTVVNERVEKYFELGKKYDLVVARAVANLRVLSELCIPLVKINGNFVAMKGNASLELDEARKSIEFLGGKIEKVEEFYLNRDDDIRNLVLVNKITATPEGYPRNYDKIIKNPIK